MIEDAYQKTEEMLRTNIDKLHLIAEALLQQETLEAEQLNQLLQGGKITETAAAGDNDSSAPAVPLNDLPEPTPPDASETTPKIVYIGLPCHKVSLLPGLAPWSPAVVTGADAFTKRGRSGMRFYVKITCNLILQHDKMSVAFRQFIGMVACSRLG